MMMMLLLLLYYRVVFASLVKAATAMARMLQSNIYKPVVQRLGKLNISNLYTQCFCHATPKLC